VQRHRRIRKCRRHLQQHSIRERIRIRRIQPNGAHCRPNDPGRAAAISAIRPLTDRCPLPIRHRQCRRQRIVSEVAMTQTTETQGHPDRYACHSEARLGSNKGLCQLTTEIYLTEQTPPRPKDISSTLTVQPVWAVFPFASQYVNAACVE
jgi:hypothetical protein